MNTGLRQNPTEWRGTHKPKASASLKAHPRPNRLHPHPRSHASAQRIMRQTSHVGEMPSSLVIGFGRSMSARLGRPNSSSTEMTTEPATTALAVPGQPDPAIERVIAHSIEAIKISTTPETYKAVCCQTPVNSKRSPPPRNSKRFDYMYLTFIHLATIF